MKKLLFTFFGLILLGTTCLWGATTTIAKTTVSYGWINGSIHQQVTLDDQITVNTYTGKNGTVSGTSTNKNNMWYVYQNVDNGRFTIDAKSGYWIKSMKLTYSMHSTNGVLCYQTGTSLTTDEQIVSGTLYGVNKTSETIYVGNSGTGTTGMVRITDFEVTYGKTATDITMEASMEISKGNTFQIGIPTPTDAYVLWTSSDNGKVSVDENGIITAKAATSSPVTITAKSNTLVKTCAVTVVDNNFQSVEEKFSKIATTYSTLTTSKVENLVGDYFTWTFRNFIRTTSTKVDGKQGTELQQGNNYIFNNKQEGGVKRISFQWCAKDKSKLVSFDVDGGDAASGYFITLPADADNLNPHTFTRDVNIDNGQLRIRIANTSSSNVIFGPLTITPYLLFTNKTPSVKCTDCRIFDLKDILINNTSGTLPSYTVTAYTTEGSKPTISEDGVVDLSGVTSDGSISITATWGNVSTTTVLTATLSDLTLSFDAPTPSVGVLTGSYTQAVTKPDMVDNVEYTITESTSEGATIEGATVSFSKAGTITVKAATAAKFPYKAAEATYTLTVNREDIPTADLQFQTPAPTGIDMNTAPFTNLLTGVPASGAGEVTYQSNNKGVATVVESGENIGKVTIVGAGEVTITATVAQGDIYNQTTKDYSFTVADPMETAVTEKFGDIEIKSNSPKDTIEGNVAAWEILEVRRLHSGTDIQDTLRNGSHAFRLKDGTTSHLETAEVLEGGIKRVSFLWNNESPWNPSNQNFIISAGENKKDIVVKAVPLVVGRLTDPDITYNHNFFVEENVKLSIYNNSGCYALIGDIKITPYLLYTNKDTAAYLKDGVYINNSLINNTGETPHFEISCGADTAEIDAEGKVTIKKSALVTVTASWGKVSTTYKLNMHAKNAPVIKFADQHVTMNTAPFTPAPTEAPAGIGTPSYSSSDTSVVKVDAVSGQLTIMGADSAIITVNYTEGTEYAAAEVSYKVYVTDPMDEAIIEAFKDISLTDVTTNEIEGDWADWNFKNIRRKWSGDNPEILRSGVHASRLQNISSTTEAYIRSTKPIEGGIKRVSFKWNKESPNTCEMNFNVTAGTKVDNVKKSLDAVSSAIRLADKDVSYNHNFLVKENTVLSIDNNCSYYTLIGDSIKITPYLRFRGNKVMDIDLDNVKSINLNDTLINNTEGGTISFTVDSFKTNVAPVIEDGVVNLSNLTKGGKIYISATWNENQGVKTTLVLNTIITPVVNFAEAGPVEKNLGDEPFDNILSVPEGASAPSYESSNTNVATVDANGHVTLGIAGTTTIKATVTANDIFKGTFKEYTLNVAGYTPVEGKFWKEKFDSVQNTDNYVASTTVNGNKAVYKWTLSQYAHRTKDKVGNTYQGIVINENGEIKTNNMEGGIKHISIEWSPKNSHKIDFTLKVGSNDPFEYIQESGSASTKYTYERFINEEKNSDISLKLANYIDEDNSANIVFGHITVTPYLLYTRKDTTIKAIDYVGKDAFQNTNLIDNTGGTIEYSILSQTPANIAQILPENVNNGQVTILGGGDVTVQAKWGDVTTTYKIHITKETPTSITGFDNSDIDILFQTYAPNPVAKIGETTIENPQFTYTIEDEKIVTRDDKGNFILKRTGQTNVTCTLVEGPTYSSISLKKYINITEPNAEKSWKETFSSLGEKTAFQGKIEIQGDKDVYPWQIRNYRRDFTNDLVNGEKGIQLRYGDADGNNYIAFKESKEMGGVKGYFFNWRIPEATERAEAKFSVRIQGSYDSTCVYQNVAAGEYFSCAKMINHTTDGMFRIGIPVANDNIVFGPITIVPYLLYSKRDTTIDAKEYESASWKFKQDLAINNTEGGTIVYSLENEAKVANIATINSESGEVTIQGGGTVKVLATWNNISTSYNLTITVEETSVSFDEDAHTVRASEKSYTKPATKTGSSPKSVVYGFEGNHKPSTTIDSENGTVSFSASDTVVVMATIAKHLPYPEDTARYTLYITSLDVPEIGFTDETKTLNMNESGYKNVLTTSVGVGDTTYTSSNERVAKVAADGTITVWGKGTTTITARVAETSTFAAAEASYELTIEEATDRAIVEIFENDSKWQGAVTSVATIEGKQFDWTTYLTRHRKQSSTVSADALNSGERAVWFNNTGNAYLESAAAIEGGIKRVAFNWNKATVATPKFTVIVGDTTDVVNVAETGVDDSFCQNFFVKKNASLRINNNSASVLLVGTINITPYLLFKGDKVMNIDLDKVTSFNLNDTLINNTQGEGTINFEVGSYTTDVEPTISNGEIDLSKITKGGQVNISAKWNEVTTTLVINTTIKPVISFAEETPSKNLSDGSFTNTLTAPDGVGTITYKSSNENVATVDNNGKVTFLLTGTTTITANVAASDIYNKTEKSYTLTINGYTPAEGKSWKETFSRMSQKTDYVTTEQSFMGDSLIYRWKVNNYIRPNVKEPFRIRTNGYISMNGNQEGGIKYAQLNWMPSANGNIDFTMSVNTDSYQYKGTVTKDQPYCFEHFFNAKENTAIAIEMASKDISAYMQVVNITIVPYLLYTTKSHTMNMNAGATYKNESLIDNRDDDTAIKFESGDKTIATVADDGTVTALKAGKVTITATWGKVSTTYELTIEAKTTITLKDNNGTEGKTVIENAVGDLMPKVAQPTKDGYKFNAYWIDEECKAKRFTVTMISKSNTDSTGWVANITYPEDGGVSYTGSGRKWAYSGAELTLYAQYKQERTIILDDQGATTAGTDKVVVAYCPNNNTVNLMQPIEVPEKENSTFLGYFTGATDGTQLIDATGAFIANVTGYIDTEENYKKWKYDKDITLYAHWKDSVVVTGETPASDIPANADLTVTKDGVINMGENTLTVTNLVISATMGGTGESGQIKGATNDNLTIKGSIYYDLTLAANADASKWHAFTVPFNVSTAGGIINAEKGTTLVDGKDFRIYEYNGATRAEGKNGWKLINGTLETGKFYLMTVNGDVKTFRMQMSGSSFSIVSNEVPVTYYTGSAATTNFGWNGIGNSQLDYRSVNQVVQIYNIEKDVFEPKAENEVNYSVGTPFFYQADDKTTSITLAVPSSSVPMRATSAEPKNIIVTLANADYTDRLFISSTNEATYEYQIGKDLVKMTMTNTPAVPQIYAKAYNTKLCVIDAPMAGDEAHYDLSLYAPKAGEYTLAAAKVAGYEVFLTLNGDVIWNLSKDNYVLDLEKGTSEAYGLILKIAQTPTDITTPYTLHSTPYTKFIYDNRLIIIRDGKVYNGAGALVK